MSASGAYPHLILSSTGEETDFVDAALARHKMARRITLRVPLLAAAQHSPSHGEGFRMPSGVRNRPCTNPRGCGNGLWGFRVLPG
jgi:hypothetical protein